VRILLIEDDEVLTSVLVSALRQQRYTVDAIDDGQAGLEYATDGTYDLLLVDVGLPRLDGISLCQQLRSSGCTTPILLMTAKDAPDEKIRGLDAGADDYLTKPLDTAELQARLRALLRRGEVAPALVLQAGALRLDPVSCEVSYADHRLKLTPKEYSLLELFLRHPSRVFSRGQIIEHLWTFDDPPLEDSVKAHVKGLRRQLKTAGADGWIENVYGLGYKFRPKIEEDSAQAQIDRAVPTNSEVAPVKSDLNESKAVDQKNVDPETVDPETVEQRFKEAMGGLWRQHQGAIAERFNILQQMQIALAQDQLTAPLQQAAAQAAHKLAGVLGMFGREEGTQVARDLETILSAVQISSARQAKPVVSLVKKLARTLDFPENFSEELAKDANNTNPLPHADFSPISLFSGAAAHPPRILAVDDDPIFLSTLLPMLSPWGLSVTTLCDPKAFWQVLNTVAPDLLLLDIEMPDCDGLELCQAIRNNAEWQSLPLIFLTARQNAAVQVFSAGADDYVVKPVLGPELITRINNRLERSRLLQALHNRDTQTGLMNQSQAQRELEQMMQSDRAYLFTLLRLSNLSQINLDYGHAMGYQVLRAWGDDLRSYLLSDRSEVLLSYWGNGEFVIALPDMSPFEASEVLSALLKRFRQRVFKAVCEPPACNLPVYNSSGENCAEVRFQAQYTIGFAAFPAEGNSLSALYQAAYASS
jgi:DNA-binding response OmpR family regulator/HPt (histidine-containing phosphotransfer) domain-containing protein